MLASVVWLECVRVTLCSFIQKIYFHKIIGQNNLIAPNHSECVLIRNVFTVKFFNCFFPPNQFLIF